MSSGGFFDAIQALQKEYHKQQLERAEWTQERSALQAKVAALEAQLGVRSRGAWAWYPCLLHWKMLCCINNLARITWIYVLDLTQTHKSCRNPG